MLFYTNSTWGHKEWVFCQSGDCLSTKTIKEEDGAQQELLIWQSGKNAESISFQQLPLPVKRHIMVANPIVELFWIRSVSFMAINKHFESADYFGITLFKIWNKMSLLESCEVNRLCDVCQLVFCGALSLLSWDHKNIVSRTQNLQFQIEFEHLVAVILLHLHIHIMEIVSVSKCFFHCPHLTQGTWVKVNAF